MITFDRIDALLLPLEERLEGFIQSVIADMSKALAEVLKAQSGLFAFARQREAQKLIDAIAAKLARLTPYTEAELKRIFRQAGIYSLNANTESIRRAGLAVPEIVESKALTGAVNAVFARTNVVLQNLTRTVAYQSQMQFVNAADDAFLQVTTGTLSIDQAVRQGVLKLATQGVNVLNTLSGRTEQVDTAIMRNVRTAVNQATGDMTLALAAEMGTDYVEVSAHNGARNKGVGPMNHASWQGKVYSISGRDKRFKPFIETTGYGTPTGLLGINCRHSVFLAWPEHEKPEYTQKELDRINNTTVTYNGQKMDLYEATQQQRYLERGVREWKRKQAAFEGAGLGEEHQMAGVKIQEWQARLRDFTKQTGLERRNEWEQVAGVRAVRPSWGKSTMPEVKASVPVAGVRAVRPSWGKSTMPEVKASVPVPAYKDYIPKIEGAQGSRGESPISSALQNKFEKRIKQMPDEVRMLEPIDPKHRTYTKLNGDKVVFDDNLTVGVIDPNLPMPDGSAYSKRFHIGITEEFIGTPIQDHEYIHSLTKRNKTLSDAIHSEYKPQNIFQHAEYGDTMGEQFTMMLSEYRANDVDWAKAISKYTDHQEHWTFDQALGEVKEVRRLLRSIGLW